MSKAKRINNRAEERKKIVFSSLSAFVDKTISVFLVEIAIHKITQLLETEIGSLILDFVGRKYDMIDKSFFHLSPFLINDFKNARSVEMFYGQITGFNFENMVKYGSLLWKLFISILIN